MRYVKSSDMYDSVASIFVAIDTDPDLQSRIATLTSYIRNSNKHLNQSIAKLCYELKASGTPTDVIAVDLGISQRAVIRAIRKHVAQTGARSPLDTAVVDDFFDLRHLIE